MLRSIRYGEADRVLHLYTPDRGRVGAVAKGVRRVKSRLGGRLEPLMRSRLVLHEGRGELCTVSQADTVHAHAALRERRGSLERAVQACDAVLRLLDSGEANVPAYNLLCHELALLDERRRARPRAPRRSPSAPSCCWRRGSPPSWRAARPAARAEHLGAFSPSAGGVVCAACEAGSFPLGEEAHAFLVGALGRPLAEAPEAPEPALRQADRALGETLEHHAHVKLRRVA